MTLPDIVVILGIKVPFLSRCVDTIQINQTDRAKSSFFLLRRTVSLIRLFLEHITCTLDDTLQSGGLHSVTPYCDGSFPVGCVRSLHSGFQNFLPLNLSWQTMPTLMCCHVKQYFIWVFAV